MLPDRVIAASEGGNTGVSIGGYYADRWPFIFVEFICSAVGRPPVGRRPRRQRQPVRQHVAAVGGGDRDGAATRDPRACELHPGRRRARQVPRAACRSAATTSLLDGRGGAAGARGPAHVPSVRAVRRPAGQAVPRNVLNPEAGARELTGQGDDDAMRRGDVFLHDQPGPGGWGDPLERDPARCCGTSATSSSRWTSARDDYGVVIDATTRVVDEAATARRRSELRAARGLDDDASGEPMIRG